MISSTTLTNNNFPRSWTILLRHERELWCRLIWARGAREEEISEIERDLQLIQAVRDGERERYQEVVERYQETISRRMWKFSRAPGEHEELVQEVFVEAYLSLGSFRGEAGFEHWLQRIATRVGYRFWKQRSRKRSREVTTGESPREWGVAEDTSGAGLAAEEAAEQVYRLLERLPIEDRLVMTLLHLEDCSVAEIAEQMNWSESQVKVRAHRARKKLAEWLGEGDDG